MPWLMQMAGCAVMLVGIAFVAWIGIWVFLGFMALGIAIAAWSHIKLYLIQKGILNPTPGVPPVDDDTSPPQVTVIEGDFTRVDEEKK